MNLTYNAIYSWFTGRNPLWRQKQKEYVKKYPLCAICGWMKVEVHHKIPFHVRPDLELVDDNLCTLCREHHFTFGHLEDWQSWNVSIDSDIGVWRWRMKTRPYKTIPMEPAQ